ncbi:hydroxymethylglutaryl-CoA synthase [Streptococcus hongkongensis]|nr:DNA-binding protein [Streptococcus uberis]
MKIGIDKIGFASSQYVLKMEALAEARQVELAKYQKGLMIDAISISPITEDIVTLAATACQEILTNQDKQEIDLVILATETAIDQSKAASVYIHGLLDIQPFARAIEMKEACYATTAALDYANAHIAMHPDASVLVIASDIAKYGIASGGEPTQGVGSIAMLVKKNPRILTFNNDNIAQTRDIMDFWRPNYSATPFVNGRFSTEQYLDTLTTTWTQYQKKTHKNVSDFAAFCFHIPFPKQALKGMKLLMDQTVSEAKQIALEKAFTDSISFSRQVGNIYTGSLYMSFLSLLENNKELKAGDDIAFFSYGSGAVCEIFSGQLVDGYHEMLTIDHQAMLDARRNITVEEYEALFYEEARFDDKGNVTLPTYLTGDYRLDSIQEHQRIYQKNDR